jgi:hypothetical protein
MADVKLQALDQEDLAVLSAHCQDAVVRVADMVYQPRWRRFALVCNRFDWAAAAARNGHGGAYERRRSGLRVEQVVRARFTGFDPRQREAMLVLLAVVYTPTDAPSGDLTLHFAGGAAIKLEVGCIEVELDDLGAVWATDHRPDHGTAEVETPRPAVDRSDRSDRGAA